MRFDLPLRYLARAFVDAETISATQAELADHAKALGPPGFMPQLVMERRDSGLVQRPGFVSPELGYSVVITRSSIDVARGMVRVDGDGLGDFAAFAEVGARILTVVADRFGRIPHRLALVQEGLLGEMPPAALEALRGKLLRLPEPFADPPPFEWDWRAARRGAVTLGDRTEPTNVIVTVKRLEGVLEGAGQELAFDRVRVDLDINTLPSDTRGRFRETEIHEFFDRTAREHLRLTSQLTEHLGL